MTVYTANQPLALGGQIYMWNRFSQCRYLVNMGTAQFTKFGHQSRIELLDKHGQPQMFVIKLKDRSFKPLNEVQLLDPVASVVLLGKTLTQLYSKTPAFDQIMALISGAYGDIGQECSLSEFNSRLTKKLLREIISTVEYLEDTQVVPVRPDSPSAWVAAFGLSLHCTSYIGGAVAKAAYVDDQDFQQIQYVPQNWSMPIYKRMGKPTGANPMVSILDPLFHLGVLGTRMLIT